MAWTNVGSLSVNMRLRVLNPFPAVSLPRRSGFLFYLEAQPLTTSLQFGYFLVIPQMVLNGRTLERPVLCKWFPKGRQFGFKVSTPERFGNNISTVINILPIEIYRGEADPSPFDCRLVYEPALTEDPVIAV